MYQNEKGEYVIAGVYVNDNGERVSFTKTYQNNGWIRVNETYPDGTTTETFERE